MGDETPTLAELHEALQGLINKGYEVKRRFNEEMDALHEQTRAVQMQALKLMVREQQAES